MDSAEQTTSPAGIHIPGLQETDLRGPISFALANTQYLLHGQMQDRLANVPALRIWLGALQQRLLTELPETDLDGTAESDLIAALEVRRAIRTIASAVIHDRRPDADDVAVLNRRVSLVPRWTELVLADDGGLRTRVRSTAAAVPRAISEIAADAIALFADARARDAVRACGGPGCLNLFLRNGPTVEVCSARCANRLLAVHEDVARASRR